MTKISPKVYAPFAVSATAAVMLYAFGYPDDARTVVITAVAAAGVGYAVPHRT